MQHVVFSVVCGFAVVSFVLCVFLSFPIERQEAACPSAVGFVLVAKIAVQTFLLGADLKKHYADKDY